MTETIKKKINKVLTFINKNYSSGTGVKTYNSSQATLAQAFERLRTAIAYHNKLDPSLASNDNWYDDMDYRLQQPFLIVQFRKIMYFA